MLCAKFDGNLLALKVIAYFLWTRCMPRVVFKISLLVYALRALVFLKLPVTIIAGKLPVSYQ